MGACKDPLSPLVNNHGAGLEGSGSSIFPYVAMYLSRSSGSMILLPFSWLPKPIHPCAAETLLGLAKICKQAARLS